MTQPVRSRPMVDGKLRCIGSFGPQPRHHIGHMAGSIEDDG
ncbi:hypothetical protein [Micromonospora echinofusca]